MTRIAVFAYSDTGHACLKHLFDRGERIVLVATHRDDPQEKAWFPSVAELARSRGVEPVVMENPLDPAAIARVRTARPDLLFSFYYRRILPEEMLQEPPLGAWNVHGSLLPKFRGRAPVNWAILKGETRDGRHAPRDDGARRPRAHPRPGGRADRPRRHGDRGPAPRLGRGGRGPRAPARRAQGRERPRPCRRTRLRPRGSGGAARTTDASTGRARPRRSTTSSAP